MGREAAAKVAAVSLLVGASLLASAQEAQPMAWSAPTTVSSRGAAGTGAVGIAFDGRGRGVALWSSGAAVRRRPGGRWRLLPSIPLGAGNLVAAGTSATVAGLLRKSERYYAAAARSSGGRRFGPARPLDGRRTDAGPVDIAVNGRGDVAFAWVREVGNRGSQGTVMASVWRAGARAPEQASTVARERDRLPGFASVAIADDGKILVAWVTNATCEEDSVVVRQRRRSGVWDRSRRVGPIAHGCFDEVELDVAVGPGRSAVVGWTSASDRKSDLASVLAPEPVYAAVARRDGRFEAAKKIGISQFVDYTDQPADFPASDVGPLRVAVTARRESLLAWTGGSRRASRSIAAAAFGPDGRLSMLQSVLPESEAVIPTLESLVVSRRGTAHLLWRSLNYGGDGPDELASAARPPSGDFGAPAALVSTTSQHVFVRGDLAVPPGTDVPTAVFVAEQGILASELRVNPLRIGAQRPYRLASR